MSSVEDGSPVREVRWVGQVAVVDLAGDVDLAKKEALMASLEAVLARQPRRMVLNLTDVPFMDSSGVAALVHTLPKANDAGAEMVLFGLDEQVRSIFEITGLDGVFVIHATEAEALAGA